LVWDEGLQAQGFCAELLLPPFEEFLRVAVLRALAALAQLFSLMVVRNPPVVAAPSFVDASVAAHVITKEAVKWGESPVAKP
jgi:hypothetical protein